MEAWKRKRTQLRREFTILADKTTKEAESNNKGDAAQLFDLLSETASSLFEAENTLRDIWCEGSDFEEKTFEADQEKAMDYKIRWHKIKSLFPKTHRIASSQPHVDSASATSLQSAQSTILDPQKQRRIKLPKLELVKFDGNVKSWLLFWGQFKKIHEDADMDATDKYQYLLMSMTPNSSARHLVESYPPCAENYAKAVEALKARFAKDDVLIETYVRGLLTLMQHKDETKDLSILYDNLQTHLQALETLGVTKDKYASMLFPMIESALSESILRAWHRSRTDSRDLTTLMQFLRQEVESEERIKLARRNFDEITVAEPKPPTACFMNESKQKKEVLSILALYELGIIPTHKSGFYCNDPKLSHTFTGDTVTATMLGTSVLLAPLIIFFIAELLLLDSEYLRSRPLEALRRVGLLYRNYAYGLVLNLLTVEVMKGVAGMPRPSFFQLCQPDTAVNCTTGEYIETFECTSTYGWNQHDSYRSFPSGHTSTSVYCGLFISWYFQRRAFSWSSRSVFVVPFVQLGCISYAVLCSLSRISDHRHHWWDVLAGVGIGVVTLLFAVFAISDNFLTLRRPILSKSLQQSSADLLYDTSRRRPVS